MFQGLDTLKLPAYYALRNLPGRIGLDFETRYLWTRRRVTAERTQADFQNSLAKLDRNSMCVDLGANVGVISEQLAERGAHVHAFEPDPWAFEQIKARLGMRRNVTLYNAAIGARDGVITLMRDPNFDSNRSDASQGTSAFHSLLWGQGEPERFDVELIDIRRFLRDLGREVDLLKIDIEGSEVELLECLIEAPELESVREIFVETHEAQMPALRGRLKTLRTKMRKLSRPKMHLDWH